MPPDKLPGPTPMNSEQAADWSNRSFGAKVEGVLLGPETTKHTKGERSFAPDETRTNTDGEGKAGECRAGELNRRKRS